MNYQLASAIIKGKWAIDPLFAMNASGIVADILNGTIEFEAPMASAAAVMAVAGKSAGRQSGNVGVINISGSMMKNDQDCGPAGMATMAAWVESFDNDPNIDAIVLKIDSPGGTVDGTQHLANTVKNASKPVVAFVDGLMASAALWVGTSADEVMAGSELDEVGSVGVLLSFADMQPAYEKMGVKFHTVTASQSTDKVKMWEDLRAGKYDEYKKEFLDPIAETFISAVKENRPAVKDEHLTGKVFMVKNVMGVFVDAIGTFDDAINRALELANEQKQAAQTQAAALINNKMKYEKLMTALGADSLEFEADGRRTFTPDEMEAVENALAEPAASPEDAPNPEAEQLKTENEALAAEVETLKAQIEALKNAPAADIVDTAEATDTELATSDDGFLSARDLELYNMIKR